MHSKRTMTLTAAAMMACASGAASAATLTQTSMFGPALLNWSHTFTFSGFNPALGTLTAVQVTETESATGAFSITNNGASSNTFTGHLTNTKNLTGGPAGLPSL